jgi:hypothetical protein
MTRSGEKTPAPGKTPRAGQVAGAKPVRAGHATAEIFGRFVSTLARLEGGGASRRGKSGEGGR